MFCFGDLDVNFVETVFYPNTVFLLCLSSKWRRVEVSPSSQGNEPLVREILKKERKRLPAFEGNWTEKFAFMHLPGFSSIW